MSEQENTCVICYEAFNNDDPFDMVSCKNNHYIHYSCYQKIENNKKMCVLRCNTEYVVKDPKNLVVQRLMAFTKDCSNYLHTKMLINSIEHASTDEKEIIESINNSNCMLSWIFIKCVDNNRLIAAQTMIDKGFDLHKSRIHQHTLLKNAVQKGRAETVEFLLANNIDPINYDNMDSDINTQIFDWTRNNEIISSVLTHCREKKVKTCLYMVNISAYHAIKRCHFDLFKELIIQYSSTEEEAANKNFIYSMTEWKNIEECHAFMFNHFKYSARELCRIFEVTVLRNKEIMINYMLDNREQLGFKPKNCRNILFYCISNKNWRAAYRLLHGNLINIKNENVEDIYYLLTTMVIENNINIVLNGSLARQQEEIHQESSEESSEED